MGDIVGAGLCARPCVILPCIVILSETKNLSSLFRKDPSGYALRMTYRFGRDKHLPYTNIALR